MLHSSSSSQKGSGLTEAGLSPEASRLRRSTFKFKHADDCHLANARISQQACIQEAVGPDTQTQPCRRDPGRIRKACMAKIEPWAFQSSGISPGGGVIVKL